MTQRQGARARLLGRGWRSGIDALSARARKLGATVAVEPFVVDGMARIALIVDPVGAAFGLWADRHR